MFAGIISSTGYLNVNEIMNLSSMRVRFLTSDGDFGHNHNIEGVNQCKTFFNDFEIITHKNLIHGMFA